MASHTGDQVRRALGSACAIGRALDRRRKSIRSCSRVGNGRCTSRRTQLRRDRAPLATDRRRRLTRHRAESPRGVSISRLAIRPASSIRSDSRQQGRDAVVGVTRVLQSHVIEGARPRRTDMMNHQGTSNVWPARAARRRVARPYCLSQFCETTFRLLAEPIKIGATGKGQRSRRRPGRLIGHDTPS